MVKEQKTQNKKIFKKSIDHLLAIGFTDIRADVPGYENPKSFIKKSNGTEVTPDISANKNGRKYFFEISLKSEKTKLLKTKWLLLDTIARLKSDRFKIITIRGHYKFTQRLLDELNLDNKKPIRI